MRIVSLVPSFTELLFDLDLGSQVVGITRFCIHPDNQLGGIVKIGGTKSIKIDRIIALNPDLVIANKEENSQPDIEELQKHCNVWLTDIHTYNDALNVILELGKKTGRENQSTNLVTLIESEFSKLQTLHSNSTVAYLIWNDPIMIAGNNTFINELLKKSGLINILTDPDSRYPEVSQTTLQQLNPDFIFLSSEPFPFKDAHQKDFALNFPKAKVILVDGEMFSWYGSRMKLAPAYFNRLISEL